MFTKAIDGLKQIEEEKKNESIRLQEQFKELTAHVKKLTAANIAQTETINNQTETIAMLQRKKEEFIQAIAALNQQIAELSEKVTILPELQHTILTLSATVKFLTGQQTLHNQIL